MKLELLKQGNAILSKCGYPTLPGGLSCVPIVKNILVPMVLQPSQSITFTKEIPGDTTWTLRAISSDQGMNSLLNVRLQIQYPNGHFLFGGNGQDIGQFAGVGSYRFLVDPEMNVNPGDKLKITLTDTLPQSEAVAVNLLFEGVYKYYFKGGEFIPDGGKLVSALPRYFGDSNENILAPCWVTGVQPEVPKGYTTNDLFTYSSETLTFVDAANPTPPLGASASASGQLVIPIDEGYDFFARRILADIEFATDDPGADVSPIVLAKFRTGTGYSFNDDYIDVARYLNGAEWPKDWKIRGRDSVIIDLQLADTDLFGIGVLTYQVHLEGVRRKKA